MDVLEKNFGFFPTGSTSWTNVFHLKFQSVRSKLIEPDLNLNSINKANGGLCLVERYLNEEEISDLCLSNYKMNLCFCRKKSVYRGLSSYNFGHVINKNTRRNNCIHNIVTKLESIYQAEVPETAYPTIKLSQKK